MSSFGFSAIQPDKIPGAAFDVAKVQREMVAWGGRVVRRMATYPPQQSPSDPRRKAYRRLGTLGRNWRTSYTQSGGGQLVATVDNEVPYMPYVEGDWQVGFHAAHGWPQLTQVGNEEWEEAIGPIQQALGDV